MDYDKIARKIEDMIRMSIERYGLIDTGAMYDSISVTVVGTDDYEVSAVDYYKYHDSDYKITENVINSDEFVNFLEQMIVEDLNKDLYS